jgi:hypothetical protein
MSDLRESLQALVERADGWVPTYSDIVARRAMRRRRRHLLAGTTLTVVLAAAISVVAMSAHDSDAGPPRVDVIAPSSTAPVPVPTTSVSTSSTTTSSPPPVPTTALPIPQGTLSGVPTTAYAALSSGVAEISTVDGSVVQWLHRSAGGAVSWVEADVAHARVFFGISDDCGANIWVVGTDGSDAHRVASGHRVAVSPDGRRIAFARTEDGCGAGALVVHDLETGAEKIWRKARDPEAFAEFQNVAWEPDGRHLSFGVYVGPNSGEADHDEVRVLDTEQPEGLIGAAMGRVISGRMSDGVVVDGRLRLAVFDRCDIGANPECVSAARIVDGETGAVVARLPAVRRLQMLDLDASGRKVLYVVAEEYRVGYERTVAHAYDGTYAQRIGEVIDADW